MSIEEIKKYLEIIHKQKSKDKKECITNACTLASQKENPKILADVLAQNHGELAVAKMNTILGLYEDDSPILESELAMHYILNQSTIDDIERISEACSNINILNSPFALNLISDATDEESDILIEACQSEGITKDPFALYMIAKQPSIARKEIMLRACKNKDIRLKPENLLLLDAMPTEESMKRWFNIIAIYLCNDDDLLKVYVGDNISDGSVDILEILQQAIPVPLVNIDIKELKHIAKQQTIDASKAVLNAYRNILKIEPSSLKIDGVDEETIKAIIDKKMQKEKEMKEEQELTNSFETTLAKGDIEEFMKLHDTYEGPVLQRVMSQSIKWKNTDEEEK